MKTLYIISNSPLMRTEAMLPFKLADESDGILLIQNGVVLSNAVPDMLARNFESAKSKGVKIFVCKEDLLARGLKTVFQEASYDEIIDLLAKYERIV